MAGGGLHFLCPTFLAGCATSSLIIFFTGAYNVFYGTRVSTIRSVVLTDNLFQCFNQ